MAQRIGQKVVNSFIKGLITEAGEMTFPENASTDELNCQLNRDGTRSRRLGVVAEDYTPNNSITGTGVFYSDTWHNVGGASGFDFLVIQYGSTLYFYTTANEPYSANDTGLSVDLSAHEFSGSAGAGTVKCDFASINGELVVVSSAINPTSISYDADLNTLTATTINIQVRDFEWQDDTDGYFTATATPSTGRQYDTLNCGWGDENNGRTGYTALEWYQAQRSNNYPPLTHPWYSGKDTNDVQETAWFERVSTGNTLTGHGSFILDFFAKDRSTVSGVTGIPVEYENSRFQAVATFSGRIFYAGLTSSKNSGKILFSRLLEDISEAGKCYQQNDPTAEWSSDLLATDGGVIVIPDATNIQKLHAVGNMLLVFAENGVWSISGVDSVFRASEYSVQKVTSVGIFNPKAFADLEGIPLWWSKQGIHTLEFEAGTGRPTEQNVSIGTVQTFYEEINSRAKSECHAAYDNINKRIYWFYPSNDTEDVNKKDRVLVLDVALQAFYPWEISDDTQGGRYIVDAVFNEGQNSDYIDEEVWVNWDNVMFDPVWITLNDTQVTSQRLSILAESSASLLLLTLSNSGMLFSTFSSDTFTDWSTDSFDGVDYLSYAETGYDFVGDPSLKKTAPYLITYCRVTEEGWANSEPIRPSSLLVSAYWDFSKSASARDQQAYRYKKVPVDTNNPNDFGYPDTVIATRLKVRGSGRSMRLRFESETGKDFVLIGYGVITGVNRRF